MRAVPANQSLHGLQQWDWLAAVGQHHLAWHGKLASREEAPQRLVHADPVAGHALVGHAERPILAHLVRKDLDHAATGTDDIDVTHDLARMSLHQRLGDALRRPGPARRRDALVARGIPEMLPDRVPRGS